MILKSYLFSQVSGNYQQYTTDNSEQFLKQLCKNCSAPNQIAIHRDGNLIYYAYAHKKNESEVCGICVVCGEICLNLKWLYDYLLKTLDYAANKGVLFCYNQYGEISLAVENISSEPAEIDCLFREIKTYINTCQNYWDILPPEDYSVPKSSKIALAFNEDNKEKITDAIRHYHNVIVSMENTAPSSFARTVAQLNSENSKLQEEKRVLKKEIESLIEQKKQYKWVIFLSILIVFALIAISQFNRNVNSLEEKVSIQEYSIDSLSNVVANKDSAINSQTQEIEDLHSNIRNLKQNLTESKNIIEKFSLHMPFYVSEMEIKNQGENYGDVIYSRNTTYIYPKITVYSLIDVNTDLYVKFYLPNGNLSRSTKPGVSPTGFSYKDNISLTKNQETTIYIDGWGDEKKGQWYSGTYRIEIWYNNVCVKAKTFTIH